MTLVQDEPSTIARDVRPRRRRRLLTGVVAFVLLGCVVAWAVVARQAPVEPGAWYGGLDARPLGDGIGTTRHVLSIDEGEQVVLTSIRNGGPFPVTVQGVDQEHSPSWVTASFRDRGPTPDEIGYLTAAQARASVTASSVTLASGASADVLVRFDPAGRVSMADGSATELRELSLSVRWLGVGSTARVPLLPEPLTLVGGATVERLVRAGRLPA